MESPGLHILPLPSSGHQPASGTITPPEGSGPRPPPRSADGSSSPFLPQGQAASWLECSPYPPCPVSATPAPEVLLPAPLSWPCHGALTVLCAFVTVCDDLCTCVFAASGLPSVGGSLLGWGPCLWGRCSASASWHHHWSAVFGWNQSPALSGSMWVEDWWRTAGSLRLHRRP